MKLKQAKLSHLGHAYIEKPTHPKRVTVCYGFWSRGINKEEDIGNIWFQQDGATCYTAEATLDVLRPVFEDRIISPGDDVIWPPRSCDLTPLDYYLWGDVKDKCYADKLETIDALKNHTREAVGEIQLHTINNVLKNSTDRVRYYMASRGSHLNEIIFHY